MEAPDDLGTRRKRPRRFGDADWRIQMSDTLFSLAPYHIAMAVIGAAVLLSYWCLRLFFDKPPAASALLMVSGLVASVLFPEMFAGFDPIESPRLWELSAELVVIIVLFATGLRIDDLRGIGHWKATIGLLAITMPLTIMAVAVLGWAIAGMTVAGALLLGAVLAPTDPVLAGDVQVGPPLEGREHPTRFALTTEASLNDGLAFPFVYLALHVASSGNGVSEWLLEWLVWDVAYRITVGTVLGTALGWLLGRILFAVPSWNTLASTGPGVVALAGVLLVYGLVELAEGYGFIAVFVAGAVCRRAEAGHEFHQRLHAFSESIEHSVSAILLVLLGAMMITLWPYLDWRHALIGFGLILVIRPLAGLLGLLFAELPWRERGVVAVFGVRGVGSVYYLAYAASHMEFVDQAALWALVVSTIFASTVLHGLRAQAVVGRLTGEAD